MDKTVSNKKPARHIMFKIGQPHLSHVEGRPISIQTGQLPNNPTQQIREVPTAKSPFHAYRRDSAHPNLVPMKTNHEPPFSHLSHVQEDVFQDDNSGFYFQAFLLPCFKLTFALFRPVRQGLWETSI